MKVRATAKEITVKLIILTAIVSGLSVVAHKVGAKESKPIIEDSSINNLSALPPEVQKIADKLAAVAGEKAMSIKFNVHKSQLINAIAYSPTQIALTSGLIEYSIKNTGGYEFTIFSLAHEIGHVVNGDTDYIFWRSDLQQRNLERKADYFGLELMHKAGYDCKYAAEDWETLVNINPGSAMTNSKSDHPGNLERMTSAQVICSSLKKTNKMPTDLYFE